MTGAPLRLVRATLSIEGVGPGPFLRLHAGSPRGFWARGSEWVAHAGELRRLTAEPGRGRFAEVRDAARAIAGEGAAGTRFYGGFAFLDDHAADGVWQGFPAALFQLPRVELAGDGASRRARLTVRGAVSADDAGGAGRAAVEAEASRLAELLRRGDAGEPSPAGSAPAAVLPVERGSATERTAWRAAVLEALDAIASGRIAKAVLARTLDVRPSVAPDPVDVAMALRAQSQGAHAFLYEPEPGRCLVGAAPETVATLDGASFHATAVAGSIRRGETDEEREALARRLLASEKDRAEQRVVVEDMVSRLRPLARDIDVADEPHVLALARIQHLETEIRATVDGPRHVLGLLEALHPTPAVCGVPRDAALEVLAEEEPFDRGWYAGPVGWFDGAGSGVFVPALRTAVVSGGRWRLFAGAGIVAGSDPDSEWEETDIKLEPVLRALASAGARP